MPRSPRRGGEHRRRRSRGQTRELRSLPPFLCGTPCCPLGNGSLRPAAQSLVAGGTPDRVRAVRRYHHVSCRFRRSPSPYTERQSRPAARHILYGATRPHGGICLGDVARAATAPLGVRCVLDQRWKLTTPSLG